MNVQDAKLLAEALANAIAGNHAEAAYGESAEFQMQVVELFNMPNELVLLDALIPFFRSGAFRFHNEHR